MSRLDRTSVYRSVAKMYSIGTGNRSTAMSLSTMIVTVVSQVMAPLSIIKCTLAF